MYEDDDRSAYRGKRPAFQRLLSAVSKSGDVGGFEPRLSLAVERIIVNPTSVRGKTDMARVHIIWRQ